MSLASQPTAQVSQICYGVNKSVEIGRGVDIA
jgi:hypothetical protein